VYCLYVMKPMKLTETNYYISYEKSIKHDVRIK
jgi:hypothetical protein